MDPAAMDPAAMDTAAMDTAAINPAAMDPASPPRRRSRWRRWLGRACVAALLLVIAVALVHAHVVGSAGGRVFAVADSPQRDVILVLGASVHRDGTPSQMLADRLRATAELFAHGRAPRVLVSGDGRSADYDEVAVMARELEAAGVPPAAMILDRDGLRTFDSLQRARSVFGFTSALVVSNPFHVPRAVYLGRHLGLDVAGVAADYGFEYRASTLLSNHAREVGARVLAWLEVTLGRGVP